MSDELSESILETIAILSDPELMEQIRIGEQQAKEGKTIPIEEIEI